MEERMWSCSSRWLQGSKVVTPVGEVDYDVFSDSEIDCIEESILENKDLGFKKRSDKSHDEAWSSAQMNGKMDLLKIAEADEEMIKYITEALEYKSFRP